MAMPLRPPHLCRVDVSPTLERVGAGEAFPRAAEQGVRPTAPRVDAGYAPHAPHLNSDSSRALPVVGSQAAPDGLLSLSRAPARMAHTGRPGRTVERTPQEALTRYVTYLRWGEDRACDP
jgi:hypothetical protein